MEFRVLRYFLAVAKEGTISKAADFLYVTQPTLSRQLMELEEELGIKLFIRGQRNITLTEEGILFRKRAEEIMELMTKTKSELSHKEEHISGDIYIGCGETDGMRLIAKIAGDIRQSYPNIRFHTFSGNADDVTEKLDKGLIDFGLLIGYTNMDKYNFLRLPAEDVWGVLMRKDNLLTTNERVKAEDLWNVPLICSRQSMVNDKISAWIKKDFDKLNIAATYNLIYNASLMVEEGIGYALTLDKLINTGVNAQLCFKPLYPPLTSELDIVWKKYQIFSKASEIFLTKLKNSFT